MAKKPRNYKQEDKYEDTPQQVQNRADRNKERARLMKAGKVHKGDGMDVAHIKAFALGGGNKYGVKVESVFANRSFKRNSNGDLVSETSTRERKLKKK